MFRNDEEAQRQRIAALEGQAARALSLEQRVSELEQENEQLREKLGQHVTEIDERAVVEGSIYVDDKLHEYVATIVLATRSPARHGLAEISEQIISGARPRDATAVVTAACAQAAQEGRKYLIPDDIRQVAGKVLREQVILSESAIDAGVSAEAIIARILDQIEVP